MYWKLIEESAHWEHEFDQYNVIPVLLSQALDSTTHSYIYLHFKSWSDKLLF